MFFMKIYTLAFCLLLACSLSAAPQQEWSRTYTGVIQQWNIVLQLSVNGTNCKGVYFYQHVRKDIALQGTLQGQELLLEESGGGQFKGVLNADFSAFTGTWTQPQKGQRYETKWDAIAPAAGKTSFDMTAVKAFQELLAGSKNDLLLPLTLDKKSKDIVINNTQKNTISPRQLPPLSYELAARFILKQTRLSMGNYFKNNEQQYESVPFRLVGKLWSSSTWTALLFHLEDDNGWDEYELFFVLVFDYEGNLLSEWKAYTYYITERTGELISEKTRSTLQPNHSAQVQSEKITITYGTNPQTKKEYYNEQTQTDSGLYKLSKEGKWLKTKG